MTPLSLWSGVGGEGREPDSNYGGSPASRPHPNNPLKRGTGSEPRSEKTCENNGREVPVPLFQQRSPPSP